MTEPVATSVIIALGSNIDPEKNLPAAVRSLAQHLKLTVLKVSSVYESAPLGFLDQAPFCNAAILAETALAARPLKFEVLRSLEEELGRVRDPANKNGPRTIDLDIGLYGALTFDSEDLVIPDPEISERAFLSIPFAEVAPELVHPLLEISLQKIAQQASGIETLKLRLDISLQRTLEAVSIPSTTPYD
ncbi:2-amino-4-hydroxy-6-hydroxymethyldihydropteridine diphosphokinase [Thalassoglobus sp.]|uniref:2-amino-4-hydroxy-6- hydroxymethyldihydropteridine diphosphokinase n=1 Tax=Thalassoglobus sp. TaxID=2795869 RepID=UPI003AA942EB